MYDRPTKPVDFDSLTTRFFISTTLPPSPTTPDRGPSPHDLCTLTSPNRLKVCIHRVGWIHLSATPRGRSWEPLSTRFIAETPHRDLEAHLRLQLGQDSRLCRRAGCASVGRPAQLPDRLIRRPSAVHRGLTPPVAYRRDFVEYETSRKRAIRLYLTITVTVLRTIESR